MLRQIRITNLGVIDDALLELSPGLNVITGETGAGKTMVVSGLGLLLGARADSGLVRSGARATTVEGVLAVPVDHPAVARALDAGADLDEAPTGSAEVDLILARTVSHQGRSRAHVGGRTTPVTVLSELGELLVAVHGQAEQSRLRRPDQHRDLLDRFAGATVRDPLTRYQARYDEYVALRVELDRLRELSRDRAREVEVLRSGLEDLEAVDPQPGEEEDLRTEAERLSHASGLREAAGTASALLVGDDESHAGSSVAVTDRLARVRSALAAMADHDPALAALEQRAAELGYLAGDLAGEVSHYLDDVDSDPVRLESVQQRLAELARLRRKYGDTLEDVLAWGKQSAARLDELEGADDRAHDVAQSLDLARDELTDLAGAVSAARQAAAPRLAGLVTAELGRLAMGAAAVMVRVSQRPDQDGVCLAAGAPRVALTRHGADDIEILLAANPGGPTRTVASAASGGELSRVMLALEVVTGGGVDVPTFVFDEIDAGVGGRAALDVGARLAALAASCQVVVVTHLAQVAAYGDRHLVVRKSDEGQVTSSDVVEVTGEDRLAEIARMMAGSDPSAVALGHALELLDTASASKTKVRRPSNGTSAAGR